MNNFRDIQKKLAGFIKKYYTNEIIKGGILFVSFGLLYFLFILFIEHFLWLKPLSRTILLVVFIVVEIVLLIKWIGIPILKLVGLKKGISPSEASKIIGKHFSEVEDKLLNVLQLHNKNESSDLLLASIEQKSVKIQPIPFKGAIKFSANKKYIKYLSIPVFIWLFTFLTGNNSIFTQSLNRVVHYNTAYNPPAPFLYKILNKSLQTIEGKPFILQIETVGEIIPENVTIHFKEETAYLSPKKTGEFLYEFTLPNQDINFYLEANKVVSNTYTLKVLAAPKIIDFQMLLKYPRHTKKKSKIIKNTGNATIPEGTNITWNISSKNTEKIHFFNLKTSEKRIEEKLKKEQENSFKITKKIFQNTEYQISTSNKNLKEYEKLKYNITVIKDQHPSILVKSDIDSVSRGPVQFVGRLRDDYGLQKLQVVAKNTQTNRSVFSNIEIKHSDFESFFYVFPSGLTLEEGAEYEIYFEVFDNDSVNGSKKTKSETFYYKNKTKEEIEQEILREQKQSIESIENSTKSAKDLKESLDSFSDKLKNKNNTNWNDKKQLEQFLERQKQYQEMLKKNSDKILQSLEEEKKSENERLENKKEALKNRIKEAQELQKKQDLLKELQELVEKINKEELLNKVDKLTEQTKQETKSLERILELTKRFYVEKKAAQITEKLEKLSKEQLDLSKKENNSAEEQKKVNQKFDSIQKDFKELNEQNKSLKQPFNIQDTEADQNLIKTDMQEASENLKKDEKKDKKEDKNAKTKAIKKQQSAAAKMKDLQEKLEEASAEAEGEREEEDIENLKQILENLLIFSFEQESLMLDFEEINAKSAEYPEKLKKQIRLKEHFEHIDDSLYTLSLRLVKLSSRIEEDLTEAHYNLDKSLENITENRISQGISNQQYTMTAANNIADLLSDLLQNLQKKKSGSGKGKGKKGEEVSLPDIIKKQKSLIEKMKKGMKPGQKPGEKPGEKPSSKPGEKPGGKSGNKNSEQMSGEQFKMYQEQNKLRNQLNDLLKNGSQSGSNAKKVSEQMERLEKLLLEKGITRETLQRMQKIEHELLKMEQAAFNQNKDKKRKADTNTKTQVGKTAKPIKVKKLYFNEDEILLRQDLKLQPLYKNKIKEYFKAKNN